MPVYKILQYASGVLGLLGLGVWVFHWLRRLPSYDDYLPITTRQKIIGSVTPIVMAGLFAAIAVIIHSSNHDRLSNLVVRAIVGGISGFWIGLCIYAIGFWLFIDR